jgi:hypothetical protein
MMNILVLPKKRDVYIGFTARLDFDEELWLKKHIYSLTTRTVRIKFLEFEGTAPVPICIAKRPQFSIYSSKHDSHAPHHTNIRSRIFLTNMNNMTKLMTNAPPAISRSYSQHPPDSVILHHHPSLISMATAPV